MPLILYLLASGGLVLLVIAAIELSLRTALVGLVLLVAACAVRWRVPAFWWIACLFLVTCFAEGVRDIFRGPQTPLAIISSLLAVLLTALAASWWWRQRHHFHKRRPDQ